MKNSNSLRKGFVFKTYESPFQSPFDKLFEVFKELITHTSGDFDEAIELALFKEDYLKFRHLLVDDAIVFIKIRAALRYGTEDQFEPRIQRISLLSDIMDEQAKAVIVQIPLDNLADTMTNSIIDSIKMNKGNCKVRLEFFDFVNNYRVETISSKHKVMCSNTVKQLRLIAGINTKVKA